MALQDIEQRIIKEAEAEAAKVRQEAGAKQDLEQADFERKAAALRAAKERETRLAVEAAERGQLVPARLEAKKALLEKKQKIISNLYKEVAKSKKLSLPEVSKVREASEVKVAQILYGK